MFRRERESDLVQKRNHTNEKLCFIHFLGQQNSVPIATDINVQSLHSWIKYKQSLKESENIILISSNRIKPT